MRLTRLALPIIALALTTALSPAQEKADKRSTWFIFLETGKPTPDDKDAVAKMQARIAELVPHLVGIPLISSWVNQTMLSFRTPSNRDGKATVAPVKNILLQFHVQPKLSPRIAEPSPSPWSPGIAQPPLFPSNFFVCFVCFRIKSVPCDNF